MVKKEETKLKKDFYNFKRKIERLEEIKHELNNLNASGFKREVEIIKSRLRDTTALPEVERMMNSLRRKMLKNSHIKKKSPFKEIKSGVREVSKDVDRLADTNSQIKQEVQNLKSQINRQFNRRISADPEFDAVVETQLHNFAGIMKSKISERLKIEEHHLNEQLNRELAIKKKNLERRYKDMEEKLIKKQKKIEEDYNSRIKQMKENIQVEANTRFAQALKKKLQKDKYRDYVRYTNQIKAKYQARLELQRKKANELIERQKDKNAEIMNHLTKEKNNEFIKREEERHRLLREHHENIQNLTRQLKQEYSKRFDSEIRKHIKTERQRLLGAFRAEKFKLKKETSCLSLMKRMQIKNELKQRYNRELRIRIEKKKKKIQKNFEKQFASQIRQNAALERVQLQNKIDELEKRYKQREIKFNIWEKKVLEEQKSKNLELAEEKRGIVDKFNLFKEKENAHLKQERIKMQKEIMNKMHDEMTEELRKRERTIKEKLKKHFKEKLKEHDKIQEDLLVRKKKELAEELQRNAKNLIC